MRQRKPGSMALSLFDRWFARPHKPVLNPAAGDGLSGPQEAQAQFTLAQRLDDGAEADQALAAQWYRKAAEQGHCAAQFHLALMYAQGRGGLRDQAAALRWLRCAAELGYGGAQYHLGVRMHRSSKSKIGREASELRIESLKWLHLAVAQSCQGAASAREFVLLEMTRQEAEEGEQRAQSSATKPANSAVALPDPA